MLLDELCFQYNFRVDASDDISSICNFESETLQNKKILSFISQKLWLIFEILTKLLHDCVENMSADEIKMKQESDDTSFAALYNALKELR